MILVAAALAAAPDTWQAIVDARLAAALDGSPEQARQYGMGALDDADVDDPHRAELIYTVGWFLAELGEPVEATNRLGGAVGDGDPEVSAAARSLIELLQLEQGAVAALPARCGFEHDDCGFRRAWETAGKGGAFGTGEVGDARVLVWETRVEDNEIDRVRVAFAPGLPLRSVRFRVRASDFPAELRLIVSDGSGWRWQAPGITVPTQWVEVTLPIGQFRAIEGKNPIPPRPPRLLEVADHTALISDARGPNTLWFDEFEFR